MKDGGILIATLLETVGRLWQTSAEWILSLFDANWFCWNSSVPITVEVYPTTSNIPQMGYDGGPDHFVPHLDVAQQKGTTCIKKFNAFFF